MRTRSTSQTCLSGPADWGHLHAKSVEQPTEMLPACHSQPLLQGGPHQAEIPTSFQSPACKSFILCPFSDAQAHFWDTLVEGQRPAATPLQHKGITLRWPRGNLCSVTCSIDLGNNRGWCPLHFQICMQVCQSPPEASSGWCYTQVSCKYINIFPHSHHTNTKLKRFPPHLFPN